MTDLRQRNFKAKLKKWVRQTISAAVVSLAILLTVLTIASLVPQLHPFCDIVANLRLQGIVAVLVTLLIAAIARRWRIVGWLVLLTVIHLVGIRTALTDGVVRRANADSSVRITTFNVWSGNKNYPAITDQLRACDSDVMVIIELTPPLATHLAHEFSLSHPHHSFQADANSNFGIGVLSRHAIESSQVLRFDGCPDSLLVSVDGYQIYAAHPYPPVRSAAMLSRNYQLRELARHIAEKTDQQNIICVGDFNSTPWSSVTRDFMNESGLRRAGVGLVIEPTWFARDTFLMGLCIDHVLISGNLACSEYQVGEACGSDHRSVTALIGSRQPDLSL